MSESYSVATEPEGVAASLVERFNSGKISALSPRLHLPLPAAGLGVPAAW